MVDEGILMLTDVNKFQLYRANPTNQINFGSASAVRYSWASETSELVSMSETSV